VLLETYVGDIRNYIDPGDPVAVATSPATLISNSANGSSFYFNGFNDLGFYSNPDATVRMVNLNNTANLILLGQKIHGDKEFYMDFQEDNEDQTLNKTAYFNGANYVFADGSARFMYATDYNDSMWLVNKNYSIPK
jgi:prepilin-type processing-associated H-X9-DG protein